MYIYSAWMYVCMCMQEYVSQIWYENCNKTMNRQTEEKNKETEEERKKEEWEG